MATRITDLVLGGEGLIGAELVRVLRERGSQVVSLDLKSGCDLRYVDNLPYASADRVWFLAWDTGGAKYHSAPNRQHAMYKHNSELAARVFDALATTGRPFLFVTSQLAGQPTAYGMTKLVAENWARQLGGKVARLWNTYGWESPDERSHVVTDLVLSGLVEGKVRTMTTGVERRRFIYKTDCVNALIDFFESDRMTVDISGTEWITIGRLAEETARLLGVEVEFGHKIGEEVMIDPADLMEGWEPRIFVSEGLSLVIADAKRYLEEERTYVQRRNFRIESA